MNDAIRVGLLAVAGAGALLLAAWILAGWQTTGLGFKPWMWSRSRRSEVLASIVERVRRGDLSSADGLLAYRKAVGMDHLHFAFSVNHPDSYIEQICNAGWAHECEQHGWPYRPLNAA